jgi:hypothetical protein
MPKTKILAPQQQIKNDPKKNAYAPVQSSDLLDLVPLSILSHRCGFESDILSRRGAATVSIPVETLKKLLQLAASATSLDQETYLKLNPDLADVADLAGHFARSGYFEQRNTGWFEVDELYYKNKYKDVAKAIDQGGFASAQDHFYKTGAVELRSPNARFEKSAEAWKMVLPQS